MITTEIMSLEEDLLEIKDNLQNQNKYNSIKAKIEELRAKLNRSKSIIIKLWKFFLPVSSNSEEQQTKKINQELNYLEALLEYINNPNEVKLEELKKILITDSDIDHWEKCLDLLESSNVNLEEMEKMYREIFLAKVNSILADKSSLHREKAREIFKKILFRFPAESFNSMEGILPEPKSRENKENFISTIVSYSDIGCYEKVPNLLILALKKNYLPEESADSKHSSELVTFLKESEKLNKEKINENDISLRVCIYLNKKISDKAASMGFAKLTTICSVNYKFRVTILCASKAFKLGGLENHKKFTLLRNLAAVLKSRQDYKFALRMFEWALKECGDEDKENVLDMIAAMHRCLGDVACKSKRYFEAIGYWQKASERLKNKMEKKGIETEVKQYLDEERAKLIEKIEAVKKEGNYKTANATDRVNHNDNKIWSNGTSSTFYKDSKNEENPSQLENGSLEQAHHY